MRRRALHVLTLGQALLGLVVLGCAQPSEPVTTSSTDSSSGVSTPAADSTSQPVEVASAETVDTKEVKISVPGMN